MGQSTISYFWRNGDAAKGYRAGVSLHSHTSQSRETLKFLASLGSRYRLMRRLMRRHEQRAQANHGMRVDYTLSYWTPPAAPTFALDLESEQIEKLGLAPMVSLTDHDSIQASFMLRTERRQSDRPVSVEWTVPYGKQAFHLGIHNLPRARARQWMEVLSTYTAAPSDGLLKEILAELHTCRETLVVFNHPMWDLYGVGKDEHLLLVNRFLDENKAWIHAVELNGLRNWQENSESLRLAEKWGVVIVSGGDRHGLEPNANINLTNADCFDQFVQEVRTDKVSRILFMPQYAQPWKCRILRSAIETVSHYPQFPPGSQRWDDRVYHPDARGVPQPLAALWPNGSAPRAIQWGIALVQMMGRGAVSGALRALWSDGSSLQLAMEEGEIPAREMLPDSVVMSTAMNLAQTSLTPESN